MVRHDECRRGEGLDPMVARPALRRRRVRYHPAHACGGIRLCGWRRSGWLTRRTRSPGCRPPTTCGRSCAATRSARSTPTATTSMAGMLAASERLGFEIVPLLFAVTGPIGTITKDAFDRIVGEMMALLKDHGPWDGVLMAQHGAAVSEEYPDADGEIVRRAREVVGPDVPIGVTPDMHANLSQKLIDNSHRHRGLPHQPAPRPQGARRGVRRADRPDHQRRDPPGPGAGDAAAGRQHRQAVHRRRADEGDRRGHPRGAEPAGHPLRQRRRGVPVRRRRGDGHGVPRDPRRRRGRRPRGRPLPRRSRLGAARWPSRATSRSPPRRSSTPTPPPKARSC